MFKSRKSGLMERLKALEEERVSEGKGEERLIKVEIHTAEYVILGSVATRHERLKDVLENAFHPFLAMEEAVILHREPGGEVAREELGRVLVRLEEITLAVPHHDIPEGKRDRSAHPRFIPKYPVPAVIHLDCAVIEGDIFVREGEEAEWAMMASQEPFMAVTGARVSYHENLPPFTAEVVLLNRDHIHLIRKK